MSPLLDLGRRIELVSMDPHCADITVALYRVDDGGGGLAALVHSYSREPGAGERLDELASSMLELAGLEAAASRPRAVRFPCSGWHEAAARRAFLEASKLGRGHAPTTRTLAVTDGQSGQQITVEPLGAGRYRVDASGGEPDVASRAPAVARGLAKLGELDLTDDDPTTVSFPCGTDHHALVGLLLPRALNVRVALREEEAKAARGVLSAPSASQE